MHQVNVHEAKTHFSRLLREVRSGNEVIISKGNKPIAKLVAIKPVIKKRLIGTAKGKVHISEDFDTPLDDFKDYM